MKKIGLLSDTHGYWDERYVTYFSSCDEIWHAGDIGSVSLIDQLAEIAPVRAVYGNIDGAELRRALPEVARFDVEGVSVLMTHIGGYPGRYDARIIATLRSNPPKIFITGHSHILKVMNDPRLKMLHINPGAAGRYGFHQIRTLVRFVIDGEEIKNLEVIELNVINH